MGDGVTGGDESRLRIGKHHLEYALSFGRVWFGLGFSGGACEDSEPKPRGATVMVRRSPRCPEPGGPACCNIPTALCRWLHHGLHSRITSLKRDGYVYCIVYLQEERNKVPYNYNNTATPYTRRMSRELKMPFRRRS